MELRQLEQFVAVAEERHFARAAVRCEVPPSTLSTSIKELETELGVALFRRTARSVAASEAGRAFLAYARNGLAAAAAARAAVDDDRALLDGSITIGGIPTLGLVDQPGLLRDLRADHPALSIYYTRDTSSALVDGVRAGRLDVAFVSLPDPPPTDLPGSEGAHGPATTAGHPPQPRAKQDAGRPADLADEAFVASEPGSRGQQYIDRIFDQARKPRNVPYEVNDVATMLDFVEAGLGIALIPAALADGRRELHLLAVDDESFTWTMAAIAPSKDQISPAARTLLDLLAERSRATDEPARAEV